jgi:hypothetical protein
LNGQESAFANQTEIWNIISITGFAIGGIMLVIALSLFFGGHIPSVIAAISGKAKEKDIERLRADIADGDTSAGAFDFFLNARSVAKGSEEMQPASSGAAGGGRWRNFAAKPVPAKKETASGSKKAGKAKGGGEKRSPVAARPSGETERKAVPSYRFDGRKNKKSQPVIPHRPKTPSLSRYEGDDPETTLLPGHEAAASKKFHTKRPETSQASSEPETTMLAAATAAAADDDPETTLLPVPKIAARKKFRIIVDESFSHSKEGLKD